MSRLAATLALTLVGSLALIGCTADEPDASETTDPSPTASTSVSTSPSEDPSPTETATPLTPRETAITQAKQQLRAFYKAYDQILADPNAPVDELDKYAQQLTLQQLKESVQGYRDRGHLQEGRIKIVWLRPGAVTLREGTAALVVLKACYDLRETRLLDENGNVVPDDPDMQLVGVAQYLILTGDWPLDGRKQWRIDKQEIPGEPCPE